MTVSDVKNWRATPPRPDRPYAVIADDLTGAGDAGVPFAARGYATAVWLAVS
jgi:hypothetical protein